MHSHVIFRKWLLFGVFHVVGGCLYSSGACSNTFLFECDLASCTNDTTLTTDGLDLSSQNLQGTVPPALFSLTTASGFFFGFNLLTGTLPAVPAQDYASSEFIGSDNDFTGTVPITISNLVDLQSLSLDINQLSGSVPASIGSLSLLNALFVQQNALEGSLPAPLSNLESLKFFSATNNQLSSTLPSWLSSLTALTKLRLGQNMFSGTIPSAFGSLSDLEVLSLYTNAMTGTIPPSLCSLTDLKQLDIHGSQLSGVLPTAIGSLVSLTLLKFGGMPLLDAVIPDSICHILSSLDSCGAEYVTITQCPTGCSQDFAHTCGVECPVDPPTTTTEAASPDALIIGLGVSLPLIVVVALAIALFVWQRSRSRQSKSTTPKSNRPNGGSAATRQASDGKGDSNSASEQQPTTVMAVMKQHVLSQIIKLLPHGAINEQTMTMVAAGGFGRVFSAEVSLISCSLVLSIFASHRHCVTVHYFVLYCRRLLSWFSCSKTSRKPMDCLRPNLRHRLPIQTFLPARAREWL